MFCVDYVRGRVFKSVGGILRWIMCGMGCMGGWVDE